MKLKFLLQIPAAVLMLFCLSSCDGGGGGESAEVPFLSANDEVEAPEIIPTPRFPGSVDPDDLAQFPVFLLTNPKDQLVLNVESFGIDKIPFPTTDGQKTGVILPFATTTMIADSQTYDYKNNPVTSILGGIEAQLILAGTTRGTNVPGSSAYVDGLEKLAGLQGPGSTQGLDFFNNVNDALRDVPTDVRPPKELIRAIIQVEVDRINETSIPNFIADGDVGKDLFDLVGYLGVNTFAASGEIGYLLAKNDSSERFVLREVRVPVANLIVLNRRTIALNNPETTNETLFKNLEITGNYRIQDAYTGIFFVATSTETGFTATDAPKPEGINEDFEPGEVPQVSTEAMGTYSFKLGGLFNSN